MVARRALEELEELLDRCAESNFQLQRAVNAVFRRRRTESDAEPLNIGKLSAVSPVRGSFCVVLRRHRSAVERRA